MNDTHEYALEAVNITKRFPGVVANDNVTLRARKGEILGLIGENGAGKSTLLGVLNGIYPHGTYEGEVRVDGERVEPASTSDAMRLGIGFVPQEVNVLNYLSVAENTLMSDLGLGERRVFVNPKAVNARAEQLLESNHINLDPQADVRKLSVGQQQMLMIARALASDPKILILDEPTTSLSSQDVESLFYVVRKLKERGTCIIFVTHKLKEILELTDRLCILRDGRNVGLYERAGYDSDTIITDMIGRKLSVMYPDRHAQIGEVVLRVEGLSVDHPYIANRSLVEDVSFSVRAGEVLGLAGLVGAGRSEVVTALFGVVQRRSGTISINGEQIAVRSPADAIRQGMALVTEDRKRYGLIFVWNLVKNITISNLKKITVATFVSHKLETARARKYVDFLQIRAASMRTKVNTLSGGNQQKVVIGRSLNADPVVVMLDEPTKGIDVGSKNEIYNLINELAESGAAVIMISSELPELMAMCDRFIVLAEGRIAGELSKEEATDAKVMQLAVTTFKDF
jgi:ABC-type sugar transport system ATPase subunit